MISVIMSVYNESPSDLSAAIDSILNQTYRDFEFIVVCDNPQNVKLIDLIQKYVLADERVRFIKNSENIGLALSLNKAASQARGDYLFRMDADDIAYPTRMMEQYKALTESDLDLVCSGYDIIKNVWLKFHSYNFTHCDFTADDMRKLLNLLNKLEIHTRIVSQIDNVVSTVLSGQVELILPRE